MSLIAEHPLDGPGHHRSGDGRRICDIPRYTAGHDTRAIQAWMGHKNIQHTVRYTELAPDRFKDFWR
jgi:hypothetical protein